MITEIITLTDAPVVAELKREFRRLDEREQQLKIPAQAKLPTAVEALQWVRNRKAEIAREIWFLDYARNSSPLNP